MKFLFAVFFFVFTLLPLSLAQDDSDIVDSPPPPGLDTCNGVYISYTYNGRTKEFPHVKNASAQAYAFKASATVLNAMTEDLKEWKLFVGFQHKEILVSAGGAVIVDGSDFPVNAENGTTFMGYPQVDLPSSISTAGDLNQISATIDIVGTQFGVKGKGTPMPKTIKLVNDGFKCPKVTSKGMIYIELIDLRTIKLAYLVKTP